MSDTKIGCTVKSIKDSKIDIDKIELAKTLDIIKYPDELLKQTSKEVASVNKQINSLIYKMIKTMYVTKGVGIAAPQIGKLLNIFIADTEYSGEIEKNYQPMVFINPKIVWRSDLKEDKFEGCLSVPTIKITENESREDYVKRMSEIVKVPRHSEIEVEYCDMDYKKHKLKCGGFLAHVIQHEYDHLEGKLYIDYLSVEVKKKILI